MRFRPLIWLVLILALVSLPLALASRDEVESTSSDGLPSYLRVIREYRAQRIFAAKDNFMQQVSATAQLNSAWEEDQWIEFTVIAPKRGSYQIILKYLLTEDSGPIRMAVTINGRGQFSEMSSIHLNRLHVAYPDHWRWEPLSDRESLTPYWFVLEKGENTIRLQRISGRIELDSIQIAGSQKQFEIVQGEDWSAQGGGEAQIFNRVGASHGKAVGEWSQEGHWLEYEVNVKEEGFYRLLLRYASGEKDTEIHRLVSLNGVSIHPEIESIRFYHTDGFSTERVNWRSHVLESPPPARHPYTFYLPAGTHTIRLEAVSGPMDVDYIGLITPDELVTEQLSWVDYLRLLWHLFVGLIRSFRG